jgi:hypothetical protein
MPGAIVFSKLKIQQTQVVEADCELADREQVFKLTEIDCDPPPGATAEYVKPMELPVIVLERFLQQEERARLTEIGFAADPAAFVNTDAIGVILAKLGLDKMDIRYAYDTASYKRARKSDRCFRATIYLRAKYEVTEIRITANEALTVGGTAFPKGDEIATFRVAIPRKFRIEARYRWNPECCPVRPDRGPEDFTGDWIPSDDWKIGVGWKLEKDFWPKLGGEYHLKRDW